MNPDRLPDRGPAIRSATIFDAQRIHELHISAVRAACAPYYAPEIVEAWLADRSAEGYLRGIEVGAIFVAELTSGIAGFGEAVPGEVVGIFVDPACAHRGMGRLLLDHALRLARTGHRGPVRLLSTLNAVGFYERFGFKQIGRSVIGRNQLDVPVVVMEQDVDHPGESAKEIDVPSQAARRHAAGDARSYRYRVVDVFTDRPLEGNPLAVFPQARGIDDATMQKIARELNLSETTFIVPATRADCAAAVRIFTPAREMLFAGHPTVGTSFVLLDEGLVPGSCERFALEEKVGPVQVRVEKGERPLIWLRTPPISEGPAFDRGVCAEVLGLDTSDLLPVAPQLMSAGNPTLFIALKSKDAVDRAWFDAHGSAILKEGGHKEPLCVFVFAPTAEGAYSRMFAPDYGVAEDPATGSATGPLALFMMRHGLVARAAGTRFISEQGSKMKRRSILHVHIVGEGGADGIDVGGHVTPVVDGMMRFDQ